MGKDAEIEQAYQHCQLVAKEQARNFYYAFVTLPLKKRRAIYAAYAFCRLCDDIADADMPLEAKVNELASLQQQLEQSFHNEPNGPVFMALRDASDAFSIPVDYYLEVMRGVRMDLTYSRYQTFDELKSYCYGVASVVGLICIQVFGYKDPSARDYAVDLGLAMQLTNILRDVKEDAQRGRIYLPLEEMKEFGYSEEELFDGAVNPAFLDLMAFQVRRAREYLERGRRLIPLLSHRSRACPAILHGIYSRVLDRIERSEYNVFNGRIGLATSEKVLLTAKIWIQSLFPGNPVHRQS